MKKKKLSKFKPEQIYAMARMVEARQMQRAVDLMEDSLALRVEIMKEEKERRARREEADNLERAARAEYDRQENQRREDTFKMENAFRVAESQRAEELHTAELNKVDPTGEFRRIPRGKSEMDIVKEQVQRTDAARGVAARTPVPTLDG